MTDRRAFLQGSAISVAAAMGAPLRAQEAETAAPRSESGRGSRADVEVLLPRNRVPLSFVIDDSTCLVNMGHFCTPQFAEAWPGRQEYDKDWRKWPREIPDSFVRQFGQWCAEAGVKGKYSIVPNPACVGWLDRELPGWSRKQLRDSLKLVRELMVPNWDIHPEMITHTRVIDLKTGRPIAPIDAGTMENSYPQVKRSVDEIASYMAYALRILERCDLPCEGITTPGGFGNLVKDELPLAVDQAVRDVYRVELPHYFKYVRSGSETTQPVLENVRGEGTDDLRMTVNVPAGTGDWFGGWQGDRLSDPDAYASTDATSGRMVDLIERREPAVMLCHWPGIYSNGTLDGFRAFKQIVTALSDRFADRTMWMKLSEIGRYWAAKRFTSIHREGDRIRIDAPIATQNFTIRIPRATGPVRCGNVLREVASPALLEEATWVPQGRDLIVCLNLASGITRLQLSVA